MWGTHTHTHTGRTYAFAVPAVIPADRLIRLQLPVHPTPITSVKLHHSKLDDEGNEPEEVRARAPTQEHTYARDEVGRLKSWVTLARASRRLGANTSGSSGQIANNVGRYRNS